MDESIAEYVEPDCIADDPELHSLWLDAIAYAHQAYVKLVDGLANKFKDEPDRTLRRKLARPELIRTVRGAGYKTVRP